MVFYGEIDCKNARKTREAVCFGVRLVAFRLVAPAFSPSAQDVKNIVPAGFTRLHLRMRVILRDGPDEIKLLRQQCHPLEFSTSRMKMQSRRLVLGRSIIISLIRRQEGQRFNCKSRESVLNPNPHPTLPNGFYLIYYMVSPLDCSFALLFVLVHHANVAAAAPIIPVS